MLRCIGTVASTLKRCTGGRLAVLMAAISGRWGAVFTAAASGGHGAILAPATSGGRGTVLALMATSGGRGTGPSMVRRCVIVRRQCIDNRLDNSRDIVDDVLGRWRR